MIAAVRGALLAAVCLTAVAVDSGSAGRHHEYLLYVGTYTEPQSASKGVYAFRFNADSGDLTSLGLAAETINPSFLAVHPNGHFLYAVNEVGNYQGSNGGGVSAFAIDRVTGKLTLLNEVPSRGADPCYIAVDKSGKYVLVANYSGGSVAAFPVLADGRLGEASAFVQHTGHGPNPSRQEAPHAHWIDVSTDNRFALVSDLGLDQVLVYKFDVAKGTLTANDPKPASAAPGAGPRHLAFDPSGRFVYVINELDSTVTVFGYEPEAGVLRPRQTLSTLPKEFAGQNSGAEVGVYPNRKFLYASNRGHDSIAVFGIDPLKGTLSPVEHVSTQGKTPRSFEIDPTGSYMFVANQKSDSVVVFRIDDKSGRLTPTGKTVNVGAPVCVKFIASSE